MTPEERADFWEALAQYRLQPRAVQRYLLKVIENMDLRPPRAAA